MVRKFDDIIWGASLNGVSKAIELSNAGKKVLLLNKFGFPGGKITESLSCLFQKGGGAETRFFENLVARIRLKNYGVLFENDQWLLLHPEAIKRAIWEVLDFSGVEYLFHVVPLDLKKNGMQNLDLFGRQGHFSVSGKKIHDLSDEKELGYFSSGLDVQFDLLVNCFITGNIPIDLPGFNSFRRFSTTIGIYYSFSLRNISSQRSNQAFNVELDRLARLIWKNYRSRLMMIPIQPEIVMPNTKSKNGFL